MKLKMKKGGCSNILEDTPVHLIDNSNVPLADISGRLSVTPQGSWHFVVIDFMVWISHSQFAICEVFWQFVNEFLHFF